MLIVAIILFVLMVACMVVAKHMYKKSVTITNSAFRNWKNREIKDKKLWGISMGITMISTVFLGLSGSLFVVSGLRSFLFRQQDGLALIVLAISLPIAGYDTFESPILDWEKGYWKQTATIILLILIMGARVGELQYQANTVTTEHEKVEIVETIQLEPFVEIITNMTVKGEGDIFAFEQKGVGFDTRPADKSKITYIESEPYLEERKVTKIIRATYPNGKVEERGYSTETEYMFYGPKHLFYGQNKN